MLTNESLDCVKAAALNAETSGLLIVLEGAVLDEIGGRSNLPSPI